MKKSTFICIMAVSFTLSISLNFAKFSFSQEEDLSSQKQLVMEEAQETRDSAVGVQVYLIEDILEVTIIARMQRTKPKIYNALVVGARLGRMSAKEIETLYPKAEDEEIFYKTTELEGSMARFSKRTKEKKLTGTLTKELYRFKIPTEKIVPKKRYQLWIQIQGMQRSAEPEKFKFNLKNLYELIKEQ